MSRRWLALPAVLAVTLVGGCAAESPSPRLLADPGGPIELVVTSLNSARRSALANASLIENLVNTLPASTRVLILTNDRSVFTVASNPAPERVEFIELPPENPITIWPQDPFVVLTNDSGGHHLLASKRFERAGDSMMAQAVAEALGWATSTSALMFEGGNIVADEHQAYVGEDTIRLNAIELGVREVEVVRMFERELGLTVTVIGPAPQPVAHIDMMLTPIGNRTIVLADSRWGADLAAHVLSETPSDVEAFEIRTEREFFGHPAIRERLTPGEAVIEPPPLVGATARAIDDSRRLGGYFDALAATLAERGYRVHRVPLLLSLPDARPRERPFAEVLDYPMLTYNNVVLESRDGENIVYLPRYGLAALDRRAQRQWRRIGFRVIPVDGFTTSALYGGALRCSVKVLRRSDADAIHFEN